MVIRDSVMRNSLKILKYTFPLAFVALFLTAVSFFGSSAERPFSVCRVAWAAAGGEVSVRALVEKDSVTVGEPFILQIRVEGSDIAPGTDQPDMSGVVDFTVEHLGGQSNTSSSITIINGSMSKVESYGYIYSYRLTPRKAGRLVIPSIAVPVDSAQSKLLRTEPIVIEVSAPEATEDFHLELKFSKTSFYVGEPVILSVVWYIGRDVESANFSLPILQEPAFAFADSKVEQDSTKQYVQLPIGGGTVLAEKGSGLYNGKRYTTLSFKRVFFARKSGQFQTPEASVFCKAMLGYAPQQKGRTPFGGFLDDDFFNPGRRAIHKTFVARSEPVTLTASALPEDGKPANFSGCVGHYTVEASANPTEVSIGDPITLTMSVSGAEYLDHVELPPLGKDPEFDRDFKIPEEMAPGVVRGNARQFTQTLRAKSADIKAIPPIKLPCFNPDAGKYEVAQSKPIPLTVKPAKVLTSADVEGRWEDGAARKTELESWSQGIAANYEGPEVLERHTYRISSTVRSPLWLAIAFVPFISFIALLVFTGFRQRRLADADRVRSRKAFARFKHRVRPLGVEGFEKGEGHALLLEALRGYFGDKLRNDRSTLTFMDVERDLKEKDVNARLLERLKGLFEACEQGSYGGSAGAEPIDRLTAEAMDVIRFLDQVI